MPWRVRIGVIYAILLLVNAGAWIALLLAARVYPLLLALGVTAYVLGLRHAVDADHIAAIDGTIRKLMHDGQRPAGVGFFFSLGHSTIVVALSLLVAVFGSALKAHVASLHAFGAPLGTSISALFLFAIAAANTVVLVEILRGKNEPGRDAPSGLLARVLRPALRLVRKSVHMYPVGVLFGLGFDTATEIALLGISAASGAGGMPIVYILLLPWLFVAGMSLVDTTEGIATLGAYGWAQIRPTRRMLYTVGVTVISIAGPLLVGGAEAIAALKAF